MSFSRKEQIASGMDKHWPVERNQQCLCLRFTEYKCCKFQINRYDNYCTRNSKAQIHQDDDVGNGHALPPPPVGVVPPIVKLQMPLRYNSVQMRAEN